MVLFNAAFSTKQAPWSLNTFLVTPVLKHGNATDTANYRPLSVSEAISRLHASIMVQRLVKLCRGFASGRLMNFGKTQLLVLLGRFSTPSCLTILIMLIVAGKVPRTFLAP